MYITYLMLHNTIFILDKPTHNIQFVSFILSRYVILMNTKNDHNILS